MAAENRAVIEMKIMANCQKLEKDNRMMVLRYLTIEHIKVAEGADGTRINLAVLSTEQLDKLYILTTSLMEIQTMLSDKI